MWIFIGIIIAFVLIKFLFDSSKQASHVKKQGGMRNKYKVLVDKILAADPQVRIFEERSSFLSLGISNMAGSTVYELYQTYGNLSVKWKVKNSMVGNHSYEWDFNEFTDQKKIYEKIESDLYKYQNNALGNYGASRGGEEEDDSMKFEKNRRHEENNSITAETGSENLSELESEVYNSINKYITDTLIKTGSNDDIFLYSIGVKSLASASEQMKMKLMASLEYDLTSKEVDRIIEKVQIKLMKKLTGE
jgi:hypothetical protein